MNELAEVLLNIFNNNKDLVVSIIDKNGDIDFRVAL